VQVMPAWLLFPRRNSMAPIRRHYRCLSVVSLSIACLTALLLAAAMASPMYAVDRATHDGRTAGQLRVRMRTIKQCSVPWSNQMQCAVIPVEDWQCRDMVRPLQAAFGLCLASELLALAWAAHGVFLILKRREIFHHAAVAFPAVLVLVLASVWITVYQAVKSSNCEALHPELEPPQNRTVDTAGYHAGYAMLIVPWAALVLLTIIWVVRRYLHRCLCLDCCDAREHAVDASSNESISPSDRELRPRTYDDVVMGIPDPDTTVLA
jgi:hypothetical protein